MYIKNKKEKFLTTIIATILVTVIGITGTYIWHTISQEALNEVMGF